MQAKKKEKETRQKEAREHERKKKMIADYKQKKLLTEELLANADLDGFSDNDDYTLKQVQPDTSKGFEMDEDSNEEEANAVMDQMIEQYKNMGGKQKRPPAVMWAKFKLHNLLNK